MKKLVLVALTLFIMGCSNNENISEPNNLSSIDVYVAGQKEGNATYWKNNTEITLDNGGFSGSTANKIIVQNNNVYVFGRGDSTYLLWENGSVTNLNEEFQEPGYEVDYITDMIIDGNDVYFIGYLKSSTNPTTYDLVYWKNGIKTVILTNCIFRHQQSSIKIINDNVYVFSKNDNNQKGVFTNNSFNPIDSGHLAYGITTKENEIYTYGSIIGNSDITGFYKNVITGIETTNEQSIENLAFDVSDIYTVVYHNDNNAFSSRREILKNNESYYISPEGFESHIVDLKVKNGNVYTIVRELISFNYGPNKLLINNNTELVLDENPSNFLNNIFIVEN